MARKLGHALAALALLFPAAAPACAWELGDPAEDGAAHWSAHAANAQEGLVWRGNASIKGFQPASALPAGALAPRSGCPHTSLQAGSFKRWEDAALQWPGRAAAGPPPADGSDVVLPGGTTLLVSAASLASSASKPYGKITVPATSRIVFDDAGAGNAGVALDTLGLVVDGVVEAGAATCRLAGRVVITLHGEHGNPSSNSDRHLFTPGQPTDPALKGVVVSSGARLDLHGALFFPTWTRLAAHTPGAALATAAPASRNKVLYLQDCVNWEAGQEVVVTTTHHKDTRGYNKNEQRTIAQGGVRCVKVDGREYGQVTLTVALAHYHHAGSREYQAEVALLSRNIVIRGNARSDPTDTTPLECDAATTYGLGTVDRFIKGYDKIPCQDTFLTGFGGHVMLTGLSRVAGVEFWRMGQTNVLGRYPVHFHRNLKGSESYATDNSVHRSHVARGKERAND